MSSELSGEWFENWTVQLRKGVLDLCILEALAGGEWYGYALVKALVAIPGLGVAEGSMYPLLSRLRKQGLVTTRLEESAEGPARKYYRLTAEGRRQAAAMGEHFGRMVSGLEQLRRRGGAAAGDAASAGTMEGGTNRETTA